jgi:RcsF protein
MLNQLKLIALLFITAPLIFSCASKYEFSSNLDKAPIKEYFSVSQVKIYKNIQDLPKQHKYLGAVDGQDCQENDKLAEPDPINARSEARRKVFAMQGNAILFTGCTTVTTKQCVQQLICYGQAYRVDDLSHAK